MIRRKVKDEWIGYKVGFYAGELSIKHDQGRATLNGPEAVEIILDEQYWFERDWCNPVPGYYTKDSEGGFAYDTSYPNYRDLVSKYYIDKKFHDGIFRISKALNIEYAHAQNLLVPLSDMLIAKVPENTAYMDGFGKQADQLIELLTRIEHPGIEPDSKRKGEKRREYYPEILSIRVETGWLKGRGTSSLIKKTVSDGAYNFTHERLILFLRELASKWIGSNDSKKQIDALKNWDSGLGEKLHILTVYDYIILNKINRYKPNGKGSGLTVNNDAAKKTAYLIEAAKRLHQELNIDALVDDIELKDTQTLTNQYRRLIRDEIKKLYKK